MAWTGGSRPLLGAKEIAVRVEALARTIAPEIDDDWVVVCLLLGGLWFAADLTRALSRLGREPAVDALWLASYGDVRASSGEVGLHAGLQRPVRGRAVLLVDEVIDSGRTLACARRIIDEAGAREVRTAVFARKPWPTVRDIEPDFIGWEAPARFLVGYGMDAAGMGRGRPGIEAAD